MNYARHYDALIARAETRVLEGYCERHHVVPRCVDAEATHVVRLTPEEHFVAHQLLIKLYPGNYRLVFAALCMIRSSEGQVRRNKAYGWLSRKAAESHQPWSEERRAGVHPLKGRKWSDEARAAHGEQWNKGLKTGPQSEEQKAKLTAIHLKRYEDRPELASNHSAAMKRHYDRAGRKVPAAPKPRVKQEAWNKGSHWSEEVLTKMRGPRSPEACANIRAAVAAREERRRQADAQLTPDQKLQRTIARLEQRVARLEAEAVRIARGETA